VGTQCGNELYKTPVGDTATRLCLGILKSASYVKVRTDERHQITEGACHGLLQVVDMGEEHRDMKANENGSEFETERWSASNAIAETIATANDCFGSRRKSSIYFTDASYLNDNIQY
jgi:hypothetical protein